MHETNVSDLKNHHLSVTMALLRPMEIILKQLSEERDNIANFTRDLTEDCKNSLYVQAHLICQLFGNKVHRHHQIMRKINQAMEVDTECHSIDVPKKAKRYNFVCRNGIMKYIYFWIPKEYYDKEKTMEVELFNEIVKLSLVGTTSRPVSLYKVQPPFLLRGLL